MNSLLRSVNQSKFNQLQNEVQPPSARLSPGEAPLPPMPTVAPGTAEFVPIIEKLSPSVLAQLRQNQVQVVITHIQVSCISNILR